MLIEESVHLADEAGKIGLACCQIGLEFLVLRQKMFVKLFLLTQKRKFLLIRLFLASCFLAALRHSRSNFVCFFCKFLLGFNDQCSDGLIPLVQLLLLGKLFLEFFLFRLKTLDEGSALGLLLFKLHLDRSLQPLNNFGSIRTQSPGFKSSSEGS